jgi:L-iditol 2-dehydrogenase
VRAVVLDAAGQPALAEAPEPEGPGELVSIAACGLCGSDVEKIGAAAPGTVLGHEVVARTAAGRRVALFHHLGCGECSRCLAGHESTCATFAEATIRPGGFAERAVASAWVELPKGGDDAVWTAVEPVACVLRAVERLPRGRVVVVGQGFVGRVFSAVLARRGDEVFALDSDPRRTGRAPAEPTRQSRRSSPAARSSSSPTPARSRRRRSTAAS